MYTSLKEYFTEMANIIRLKKKDFFGNLISATSFAEQIAEITNGDMTGLISGNISNVDYMDFIDSLEGKVTNIRPYAFYGCNNLYEIYIPNFVQTIDENAFTGCENLTGIYVEWEQENERAGAPWGAQNATIAHISSGLNYYRQYISGVNGDNTFYSVRKGTCTDALVYMPSIYNDIMICSIANEAFKGDTELEAVLCSRFITSIEESAFEGCTKLGGVLMFDNVATTIGDSAFKGCTSLTEYGFDFFKNITSIGSHAFEGCTGFEMIVIPESVISIGSSAFKGCTGLRQVNMVEGVASIGNNAFEGCTNLRFVSIPKSVTSIGDSAFLDCDIISVELNPSNVLGINSFSDKVQEVYFNGTIAEWNDFYHGSNFSPNYGVHCLDGTIGNVPPIGEPPQDW